MLNAGGQQTVWKLNWDNRASMRDRTARIVISWRISQECWNLSWGLWWSYDDDDEDDDNVDDDDDDDDDDDGGDDDDDDNDDNDDDVDNDGDVDDDDDDVDDNDDDDHDYAGVASSDFVPNTRNFQSDWERKEPSGFLFCQDKNKLNVIMIHELPLPAVVWSVSSNTALPKDTVKCHVATGSGRTPSTWWRNLASKTISAWMLLYLFRVIFGEHLWWSTVFLLWATIAVTIGDWWISLMTSIDYSCPSFNFKSFSFKRNKSIFNCSITLFQLQFSFHQPFPHKLHQHQPGKSHHLRMHRHVETRDQGASRSRQQGQFHTPTDGQRNTPNLTMATNRFFVHQGNGNISHQTGNPENHRLKSAFILGGYVFFPGEKVHHFFFSIPSIWVHARTVHANG